MSSPLRFLSLPPERRALAFGQTAARQAASSVMIEKDFQVCWLLGLLFADAELAPHVVFKGGTSLSKAYGVIDRFSEEIDLSFAPPASRCGTDPRLRANAADVPDNNAGLRYRVGSTDGSRTHLNATGAP